MKRIGLVLLLRRHRRVHISFICVSVLREVICHGLFVIVTQVPHSRYIISSRLYRSLVEYIVNDPRLEVSVPFLECGKRATAGFETRATPRPNESTVLKGCCTTDCR
jgi:hypothetical protein